MTIWTENNIATLTRLWAAGATASQIASQIYGASRCAILGKARRLNLAPRKSPIPRKEQPHANR
jgi:GcrA cell cycle regulator